MFVILSIIIDDSDLILIIIIMKLFLTVFLFNFMYK